MMFVYYYYLFILLTVKFGSCFPKTVHSAPCRQNLYDGLVNVTLADIFYF